MKLSQVDVGIVGTTRVMRFTVKVVDLNAIDRVIDFLETIDLYYNGCQFAENLASDLTNISTAIKAGDKRRVAIEDGVLGPVTKTKPESA